MCLYEFLDDARGECTSHSLGRAFVCAYVEIRDYKYVFMILHYYIFIFDAIVVLLATHVVASDVLWSLSLRPRSFRGFSQVVSDVRL